MIKASFTQKEDKTFLFKIDGHAGQNEKGHDIVCSAATILAYTLAQTMRYIEEQGGFETNPVIQLSEGKAIIFVRPKEEYEGEVLQTFFTIEVGYSLLAQNYPQYVDLKPFGQA
jgi:uncharacterized protein YsxB (DUF464 family)